MLFFACDRCGKRFSSQQALKKHNNKFHGGVDGGRIWYRCHYCIGGKALKGPGVYERHMSLVHKIEVPVNNKKPNCDRCGIRFSSRQAFMKHNNRLHGGDDGGFDEKMAKEAKKLLEAKQLLFLQQTKDLMPPPGDKNSDKKNALNGLLDLSSSKNQKIDTPLPLPLSFGSYESSVKSTDPNGRPILGDLNFIPMRNSEAENADQIEENYIGTSDYAIDVTNMNTNTEEYYDHDDNQYMESEDYFENSNTNMEEEEMLSVSKIKHEEVDMDYDNYYEHEAYSSDINDEKEDLKTDIKDEKFFEKDDMGQLLQKVKVELEEPDEDEEWAGEQSNISSNTVDEQLDDEKILKKKKAPQGHWKSKGIEIKIDKNEVIKDRFGQVVEKMIKCDACDNVYTGKAAIKTLARHYRSVHQIPKMKEEEQVGEKNDDIIEKCKLCDKIYRGTFAKTAIKMHMTRHEGIHRICHLCDKDFKTNLGFLVRHLRLKHKCENVCEKCEYYFFYFLSV